MEIRGASGQNTRDWQLLSEGTGGFAQQGMYVMTSSGKALGYVNRGWPDPDPEEILRALREANQRYQAMPRSERVLRETLDPERDRMKFEREAFTKPKGALDLRIVSRGLPFEGMTSFDQRHPMFHHTDRLWFRPEEWSAFLPQRLEVGASTRVTGPARTRIVLLSHMQAGSSAWWEEHIVGGETTSRVVRVEGDTVLLEIEGDYVMRANSQWCKDRYDGNLLAKATYSRREQRFTRFDLAMFGVHTVGERRENLHVGSLTAPIAAAAELVTEDDGRIPTNWMYGYGLRWCRD